MTTSALLTMLVVQLTVTIITIRFLLKTMHQKDPKIKKGNNIDVPPGWQQDS